MPSFLLLRFAPVQCTPPLCWPSTHMLGRLMWHRTPWNCFWSKKKKNYTQHIIDVSLHFRHTGSKIFWNTLWRLPPLAVVAWVVVQVWILLDFTCQLHQQYLSSNNHDNSHWQKLIFSHFTSCALINSLSRLLDASTCARSNIQWLLLQQ